MFIKFELEGTTKRGSPYILFGTREQCRSEYDSLCKEYKASADDFIFGEQDYTCYHLPLGGWRIRNLFFNGGASHKRKMVRTFDKLDEALTWMENISA